MTLYLVIGEQREPGIKKFLRRQWAVCAYSDELLAYTHVAWAEAFLTDAVLPSPPGDLLPKLIELAQQEVADGEYSTVLGKGFAPEHPSVAFDVHRIEFRDGVPQK